MLVLTLPRGQRPAGALHNRVGYVVDYRHLIHSPRRKPMALFNVVHREQLFPRVAYCCIWEALIAPMPSRNECRTKVHP
jgi:hypothetical protein